MRERHRYLVALVVSGHVAQEINGLRRALSSHDIERIAPHVTIAPPTNFGADNVDDVVNAVRKVATETAPITVTLGPPTTFSERDDVVFLGVHGDLAAIRAVHTKLADGVFAPPESRPPRAFIPHVTLAGNFRGDRAWSACTALLGYAMEYTFTSLALMEQDTEAESRPWKVVAEFEFSPEVVVGRGGRELSFVLTKGIDPAAENFLESEWAKYSLVTQGKVVSFDEFALVARNDEEIVGIGYGSHIGTTWRLDRLIVKDIHRNEGIGSQLLRQLEAHALEQDGQRIRLSTDRDGDARRLYEAHGYVVIAEFSNRSSEHPFVMMERALSAAS